MRYRDSDWFFRKLDSEESSFRLGGFPLRDPLAKPEVEKAAVLSGFFATCTSGLDFDLLDDMEASEARGLERWLNNEATDGEKCLYYKLIEEQGAVVKVEFFLRRVVN